MTEHEQEVKQLFERSSTVPALEIIAGNSRLMTYESFKQAIEIMMNKAEYYGIHHAPRYPNL
jgi:hypothetical protein